jgi:hypothetical protein
METTRRIVVFELEHDASNSTRHVRRLRCSGVVIDKMPDLPGFVVVPERVYPVTPLLGA